MRCPNCGARINKNVNICYKCGTKLSQIQHASHQAVKKARAEFEPEKVVYTTYPPADLNYTQTLLLCIFLGLFGAHYFYVKRPIMGTIVCVCWSIVILFNVICGIVCGVVNGLPDYESFGLQVPFVFVSMMSALLISLWVYDIFRIIFKRFKVPVVLENK